MEEDIRAWVEDHDGVVSVSELAKFLDVDEGRVRRFARDNGLRRIGSTFVFGSEWAAALARELEDEDDGHGEDEDDGGDGFEPNPEDDEDEDDDEE